MADSIKEFLKSQDYPRKFRPQLKKKYTLVFGEAKVADNTEKPSMKVGVRNKATGETYVWVTSSKSALDKIADLEKGDVFELTQKIKVINGTPMKIYDIELTGQIEADPEIDMNVTDEDLAGENENRAG